MLYLLSVIFLITFGTTFAWVFKNQVYVLKRPCRWFLRLCVTGSVSFHQYCELPRVRAGYLYLARHLYLPIICMLSQLTCSVSSYLNISTNRIKLPSSSREINANNQHSCNFSIKANFELKLLEKETGDCNFCS